MVRSIVILSWTVAASSLIQIMSAQKDSVAINWGKRLDPDKDCRFDRFKERLIISIPKKDHDLAIEQDVMNAPRVLHDVEGDFSLQVRVQCTFRLSAEITESFQEAG